jgi:hypothetical protein
VRDRKQRVQVRLRSPLRWLSAVMSALAVVALAGVAGLTWLVIAAPVVAGLFLLAPPLGVYRHDEVVAARTQLTLEATSLPSELGAAYRLTLVNRGAVAAQDFRVRLIVPEALAPRGGPLALLGDLLAGELGRHWFTETVSAGTAITFRAGHVGTAGALSCPAHGRLELAELRLLNRGLAAQTPLAYQVNGGNVGATLSELTLPARDGAA